MDQYFDYVYDPIAINLYIIICAPLPSTMSDIAQNVLLFT